MTKYIVALTLVFYSSISFSGHCPADADAIDAALAKVTLSDDVRSQVVALKEKGLAEHGSGDHANSEKTLAEAMRLLLTNIE